MIKKKRKQKKSKQTKINKTPKEPHNVPYMHPSTMCRLFDGSARVDIFFTDRSEKRKVKEKVIDPGVINEVRIPNAKYQSLKKVISTEGKI